MRRITVTILAALAITLGLAATPHAAQAAAAYPIVVSPADGSTVLEGTSRVTVQFSAGGVYGIEVYDGYDDYHWSTTVTVAAGTYTYAIPALPLGAFVVYAWSEEDYSYDDVARFTVVPGPVKMTNVSAAPATFYPTVRDGYKDKTTVAFGLSRGANVTAQVYRTSDGTRVLNSDAGWRAAGSRTWAWDGRNNGDSTVPTGRYRVELIATDTQGSRATAHAYVDVTTATVSKRTTVSRYGSNTTSVWAGDACSATRHYWTTGDIYLDCWSGTSALATYRFRLPADASNVAWGVSGVTHCCNAGQIIRSGKRTSYISYRVQVKITDNRGYSVNQVRVSYDSRVRI